jgi:REP element-mobilizing transposase RayT
MGSTPVWVLTQAPALVPLAGLSHKNMSFVKIYVHAVWATKARLPLLDSPQKRLQAWEHILQNGRQKDLFIDCVNGHGEHCHCLISLSADKSIREVIQLIKGESSHWINKNGLSVGKFEWQDEYFAVSVSESVIGKVRDHIKNQEEHHRHKAFQEEYDTFLRKHGFKKFG